MEKSGTSMKGKVAIVTGAGGGLGIEIGRAFAAAGAMVVATGRDEEKGRAAAEELRGKFVRADVTDPASVWVLVRAVLDTYGRVDVLVNNAGIGYSVPAEAMTDEEWRKVMSVNLDGVFYCCRAVGRVMLEQGYGAIVNVASMSGVISNRPHPQVAYNASKAAVIMLTKSLAGEWARRGVRVNAVSPGYIRTPMTELGMSNREWADVWLSSTPMGRLAEPEEIAPAVLYLASDASSYATGTNLIVDGGYTVW